MAITQEEFLSLSPGDIVIDSYGREYLVRANTEASLQFADVPGPREITLVIDGNYEDFGWGPHGIMDDEWGISLELNHPNARVVRKDST